MYSAVRLELEHSIKPKRVYTIPLLGYYFKFTVFTTSFLLTLHKEPSHERI